MTHLIRRGDKRLLNVGASLGRRHHHLVLTFLRRWLGPEETSDVVLISLRCDVSWRLVWRLIQRIHLRLHIILHGIRDQRVHQGSFVHHESIKVDKLQFNRCLLRDSWQDLLIRASFAATAALLKISGRFTAA